MNLSQENIKTKLSEKLYLLHGKGFYQVIADRVGCSHETVRLYFTIPSRRNDEVEKHAFMLVDELKAANEEKLKDLES
jgi:hypothetical protein